MIRKAIQKQWNLNKFLEEANQRHHLKREVNERTNTLIELGMMVFEPNENLKETNELRIRRISGMNELKSTKELIREYDDVFQGIGNIKEPKAGKAIEVGFEMEAGIQPIAQKPRHVPYHLESPLKKWIEQGEADGIFEKVPRNEAITWCLHFGRSTETKIYDERIQQIGNKHDASKYRHANTKRI